MRQSVVSFPSRIALSLVLTACLLMQPGSALPLPDPATDPALAKAALTAARDNDFETLAALEKSLGSDHPLQGYLDYHRLRQALPGASPAEVNRYRERYADLPLAAGMERLAIRAYGQAGEWRKLRQFRTTPPVSDDLVCFYWRAIHDKSPDKALAEVPAIWLHGGSRPGACDPLFDLARDAGVLNDELVWERMLLVFRRGDPALMRYLGDQLSDDMAATGLLLRQVFNRPELILSLRDDLPRRHRSQLIDAGLYRMAQLDTPQALSTLNTLIEHDPALTESGRSAAERRIAFYSTIRDLPENRAWLDRWLLAHGSEAMLDQRARRAIIEQRWYHVIAWIARMPAEAQQNARWQYWLGRAYDATGEPELATNAWQQAAGRRNFWGFAAADRIGQPYALHHAPAPATPTPGNTDALARIALLLAIDEPALARDEWLLLLRRGDNANAHALANYGLEQHWYPLVVDAAIHAGAHNVLTWRFPHAYRNAFVAVATEKGMDPYLLMALARRESAFHSHAVSPVGARGLMQIMPGTAENIAGWLEEPAPDVDGLYVPELSIRFGSTYLADLLSRYQGNRLLALAAYNAGRHRVDDWLGNQTLPFDVWIESIPFSETRDYVQAVLAYRVLLQTLDGQDRSQIALIDPHEKNPGYHLAALRGEKK
ncbi:MAG: transglycosylase SLT domain-containing protein [Alcanivorax sp.]|nr:transglycosylase SLT domain-containing protein [Alcanivorax sp.]